MKKVIITDTFHADYGDGNTLIFNAGDELEVLKEGSNNLWRGGGYYVVYNPITNESMTVAKGICKEAKAQ